MHIKIRIIFLFIIVLYKCSSFDIPRHGCQPDLNINNDQYQKTDTYQVGDAYPIDAHFDIYGNLFYVKSRRNNNGFYFDVYVIKTETNNALRVEGLPEGISYSIAVDKKETKVYFGTKKGIYSYNYDKQNASLVSKSSLKLNMIFVDNDSKKYIIDMNNEVEELYLLDSKKKILFHSLQALNEMAIDDENKIYFIREQKLFVLKSTISTPLYIGNITYDGIAQISFHKEIVYVASENLIYFLENETGGFKPVKNIPIKMTAIVFDNIGNFIFGIHGKILKYKKNECYIRKNNDNALKKEK